MKLNDLTGQQFGRLTVIRRDVADKHGRTMWLCQCECGKQKVVRAVSLQSGNTTSCGCYRKERQKNESETYGLTHTRIYSIWQEMKTRCTNENIPSYADYGGRGITVCNEWSDSFLSFYAWAMDNGYTDDLTIDRIDNDGNYEPSNCRWVTRKTQANNKRNNRMITCFGRTQTLAQWSEETGIKRTTITQRLDAYHWDVPKALGFK